MRNLGLGGLAMAVATALAAVPAQAETVLRYSNWLPAQHVIHTDAVLPWIADVERVTEGRVKVEITPKVVGSVAGQYDVAVDGLADVVFMIQGYTPGRFVLNNIIELPFVGTQPEATSTAFWRLYQDELHRYGEFKGVHVLSLFTASPANIATTRLQVEKVADLQGLKMRNPLASFTPAVEALGAIPVNKPISEIYELATSGVVDGGFVPLDSMESFKLYDALRYTTLVPGGLFNPSLAFVINEESWEKLSDADRKAIMEVSGETFARRVGAGYARSDVAALETMRGRGDMHVITADASMMTELKARLAGVEQAWFDAAQKAGMENPQEVLSRLRADVAELEK